MTTIQKDNPLFHEGMCYSEKLLAKLLNVSFYESGDGSEDFDNDATMTLINILTAAGIYSKDDNKVNPILPQDKLLELKEEIKKEIRKAFSLRGSYDNGDASDAATNAILNLLVGSTHKELRL